MEELTVIISDFKNNGRDMEKYSLIKEGYLAFAKALQHELQIEDDFREYVVILPDTRRFDYCEPNGPRGSSGTQSPTLITRRLDEEQVEYLLLLDFGGLGPKDRARYRNPGEVLLVIDRRFEDVTLKAIERMGIKPNLYYDYRQLSLL
jgi:hypothetical protein